MVRPRSSGAYSYKQLEQLWLSAGGSSRLAPIMAAIALAESGGNPQAVNRTDNGGTQTSWGLWQISNGTHQQPAPDILSPAVNARQAVLKEKQQGLGAWGTYTSNAYRKFLQGNVKAVPTAVGGSAFVDEAKKFLGVPYVWGGESPKGFDCSGLVQYVAEKLGFKNVPRTSEEQWAYVTHIKRSQLKPGDLVFYPGSDGTAASPGHVAIYAGNDQIIQAPQTGQDVELVKMPAGASGYGRIPGLGGATFGGSSGGGGGGGGGSGSGITFGSVFRDALTGIGIDLGQSDTQAYDNAVQLDSLGGIAAGLAHIAAPLKAFGDFIDFFLKPNHWIRIGCAVGGTVLTLGGIWNISHTGRSASSVPVSAGPVGTSVPTSAGGQMAPAVGIAMVTVGAVLLFFAFHNLPSSVTDFGGFVSHLQGELQSGGKSG